MTDSREWPDHADKAHAVEQAKQLRDQAAKNGLRFEAYLPDQLALWLLSKIECGQFLDPSEAVFVLLGESHELESHTDLRQELYRRRIQAAIDDPRPPIPHERVETKVRELLKQPLPEPAIWSKRVRR